MELARREVPRRVSRVPIVYLETTYPAKMSRKVIALITTFATESIRHSDKYDLLVSLISQADYCSFSGERLVQGALLDCSSLSCSETRLKQYRVTQRRNNFGNTAAILGKAACFILSGKLLSCSRGSSKASFVRRVQANSFRTWLR